MSSQPPPTLTTIPSEILLSIFDFLPSRRTQTTLSPIETTTREVLPKRTIQNISLTCKRLRRILLPRMFDSIIINSSGRFTKFVGLDIDNGDDEVRRIAQYAKKVTVRWETSGEILSMSEETCSLQRREGIRTGLFNILKSASRLQHLVLDFPGAFDALEHALKLFRVAPSTSAHLQDLKILKVRNGRYSYDSNIADLLSELSFLPRLKYLSIDGNRSTNTIPPTPNSQTPLIPIHTPYASLTTLEISSLSSLTPSLLHRILYSTASKITSLTLRSCPSLTLKSIAQILNSFGPNFKHLDLEILKPCDETKGDTISEEEHLCPIIRDRCGNLEVLGLFTNRICKDIFFGGGYTDDSGSSNTTSSTTTSGLPTPPGSTFLQPTSPHSNQLPTPPSDPTLLSLTLPDPDDDLRLSPSVLSSPLYPIPSSSTLNSQSQTTLHKPLKKVTLRLPYDISSLRTENMGGPSLQQVHTFLCDGEPARELLSLGERAFRGGIVEDIVRVQGHWKGGPYLFMKD